MNFNMDYVILFLVTLLFIVITIYIIYFCYGREKKLKELIADGSFNKADYLEEHKVSKKRKIISTIVLSVFFIVALSFFSYSLAFKASGEVFLYSDKYVVSINSDSMSANNVQNTYIEKNNLKEKFSKNDVVSFKKIDENYELNLYDVILFNYEFEGKTLLITHRIVEINENGYVTRGDANSSNDSNITTRENILGVYSEVLYFPSLINGAARNYNFICFVSYVVCDLAICTAFKIRRNSIIKSA